MGQYRLVGLCVCSQRLDEGTRCTLPSQLQLACKLVKGIADRVVEGICQYGEAVEAMHEHEHRVAP